MDKPVHFDIGPISAAADRCIEALAPQINQAGYIGAQARMTAATLKPIYLAVVAEINRGATRYDVACGLAAIMSNATMTVAEMGFEKPSDHIEHVCKNIAEIESLFMQMIRQVLRGGKFAGGSVQTVRGTEGGNA